MVGAGGNDRVQIADESLNFVDKWRHFGRPSGITILADDTLIVADSESGASIPGPPVAPDGPGRSPWPLAQERGLAGRHPHRQAQGGSLHHFTPGTGEEPLVDLAELDIERVVLPAAGQ